MKDIYDVIIIGGGASGLFCGASFENSLNGLILEKTKQVGTKLLMSGGGMCNLTHSGSIKDFLLHYGEKGNKLRPVLFPFNNEKVLNFFNSNGVALITRDDGKIFPKSLSAKQILDCLINNCTKNGFSISCNTTATNIHIEPLDDSQGSPQIYKISCENDDIFYCRRLVVSTGGSSYPTSGSDGKFLKALASLDLEIIAPAPSLTPIFVEGYPYQELAGTSFSNVTVTVSDNHTITSDLLFTHTNFSGPAILNISRYAVPGKKISMNYCQNASLNQIHQSLMSNSKGNQKQLIGFLHEYFGQFSKNFLSCLCKRCELNPAHKSSTLAGSQWKSIAQLLTCDTFVVSGLGGFSGAMCTRGGISLEEITIKTMGVKKYPHLYIIGEVLDVDGDTGGYNLQFAFSSAYAAMKHISEN